MADSVIVFRASFIMSMIHFTEHYETFNVNESSFMKSNAQTKKVNKWGINTGIIFQCKKLK